MNLSLKSLFKTKFLFLILNLFWAQVLFSPTGSGPNSDPLPQSGSLQDQSLESLQAQAEGRTPAPAPTPNASLFGEGQSASPSIQGNPASSSGASGQANSQTSQNQQVVVQVSTGSPRGGSGAPRTPTPQSLSPAYVIKDANKLDEQSRIILTLLLEKNTAGTISPAEKIILENLIAQANTPQNTSDPYQGYNSSDYGFLVNAAGPFAPGPTFPGYAIMLLLGGVGVSVFFATTGIITHKDSYNQGLETSIERSKGIIIKVFNALEKNEEFWNRINNPTNQIDQKLRDLYHVLGMVHADPTRISLEEKNAEEFGRVSGICQEAQKLLQELATNTSLSSALKQQLRSARISIDGANLPGFDSFMITVATNQGIRDQAMAEVTPDNGKIAIDLKQQDLQNSGQIGGQLQGYSSGVQGNRAQRAANTNADLLNLAFQRAYASQAQLDAQDNEFFKMKATREAHSQISKEELARGRPYSDDERAERLAILVPYLYSQGYAKYKAQQAEVDARIARQNAEIMSSGTPTAENPSAMQPQAIRPSTYNPSYNPYVQEPLRQQPSDDLLSKTARIEDLEAGLAALKNQVEQGQSNPQIFPPMMAAQPIPSRQIQTQTTSQDEAAERQRQMLEAYRQVQQGTEPAIRPSETIPAGNQPAKAQGLKESGGKPQLTRRASSPGLLQQRPSR